MSSQAPTSVTNCSFASKGAISLIASHPGKKVYRVRGVNFSLHERYSLTSVAGYGAYGVVCGAMDEETNTEVAIKRISRVFQDLVDGRRMWREVRLLRMLRDANCRGVVKLHGLLKPEDPVESFKDLYIVTELLDHDLHAHITKSGRCDERFFKMVAFQLVTCIADLHHFGVIHRDIKPSNILLSPNNDFMKLCDFGLARGGMERFVEPLHMTDYVVTRWYRPPELLLMCKYHFPVDMWGIGCVLAEIVMRKPLFPGRNYVHQLENILRVIPVTDIDWVEGNSTTSFVREMSRKASKYSMDLSSTLRQCGSTYLTPELSNFISALLAFNPADRLTAQAALKHPIFAEFASEVAELPPLKEKIDWGFDTGEVTEAQLRRKLWVEIEASDLP